MSYKTTSSDVNYFRERALHWVKMLSLGDWKIEVYAGETAENSATCELWHDAHGAHIKLKRLFDYKPEKRWLDRLALHEVCHVLLCDLRRLVKDRCVTDAQIDTAEHAVIRRLENLL